MGNPDAVKHFENEKRNVSNGSDEAWGFKADGKRALSLVPRLSSYTESVENKISILQRLLAIPTSDLTETIVMGLLSSERGDLVSCLARVVEIYSVTNAPQKLELLERMIQFVNKCLGMY